MNSVVSWTIFLAVVGGLSWYYAGRPRLLARLSSQKQSRDSSQETSLSGTRTPRSKPKRGGVVETSHESKPAAQQLPSGGKTSKKRKIATPQLTDTSTPQLSQVREQPKQVREQPKQEPKQVPQQEPTQEPKALGTGEDAKSNADFAREMAIARTGTQFAGSGKAGLSKKERRAQKQTSLRVGNGTDSPSLSTGASSTTGGDADDDLSPAASPALAATSTETSTKTSDVSDMLEAPGPGPSILRLTDPVNPVSQSKVKQAPKSFAPAETKKQRQQRLKREAQRAQNEEAEKERRMLMEKQIRGARMAEGTSAQTRTSAFKPPTENAWFSSGATNSGADTGRVATVGAPSLLDTFEPEPTPAKSETDETKGPAVNSVTNVHTGDDTGASAKGAEDVVDEVRPSQTSASEKEDKDWAKDLPMEEEQIRLIQDSEDSWTTVSKKDKKKTTKPPATKENDAWSGTSGIDSRPTNGLATKTTLSSRPVLSNTTNSYHKLGNGGFQDSDWAA